MNLHLLVFSVVLHHKRIYTDVFNNTVVLQFNLLFHYRAIDALLKDGDLYNNVASTYGLGKFSTTTPSFAGTAGSLKDKVITFITGTDRGGCRYLTKLHDDQDWGGLRPARRQAKATPNQDYLVFLQIQRPPRKRHCHLSIFPHI